MSAFIVDNTHISAIISYAMDKQISFWNPALKDRVQITTLNAEEIGRILMDENVRSVVTRYQDSSPDFADAAKNDAASYSFQYFATPLTAVELIKACHCLDYQCCETDDWEGTLAFRIVEAIKSHGTHHLPGYDAAPWELTSEAAKKLKHAGAVSLLSLARKR